MPVEGFVARDGGDGVREEGATEGRAQEDKHNRTRRRNKAGLLEQAGKSKHSWSGHVIDEQGEGPNVSDFFYCGFMRLIDLRQRRRITIHLHHEWGVLIQHGWFRHPILSAA